MPASANAVCVDSPYTNPTGLNLPADLSVECWVALGRTLAPVAQSSQWWICDWILFGEKVLGKRAYAAAQGITGYSKNTLYAYARTAERVPSCIRIQNLSFTHHREIEQLHKKPEEQKLWLQRAAEKGLSVRELKKSISRGLVHKSQQPQKAEEQAKAVIRSLRKFLPHPFGAGGQPMNELLYESERFHVTELTRIGLIDELRMAADRLLKYAQAFQNDQHAAERFKMRKSALDKSVITCDTGIRL